MTYSSRKNLQGLFFAEATGYHVLIKEILANAGASGFSLTQEDSQELHRLFHNIKGASAQVDLPDLSEAAWIVEVIVEDLAYGLAPFSQKVAALLNKLSSAIYQYCLVGVHEVVQEKSILAETRKGLIDFLAGEDTKKWPNSAQFVEQKIGGLSTFSKQDETVRLVHLLHQYSVLALQQESHFDAAMLEEFQQGIDTLRDYAERAQQIQKRDLLYRFGALLESAKHAPVVVGKDLPPLINQLFEFLVIIEDTGSDVNDRVFAKIIEEITRVSTIINPCSENEIPPLVTPNESKFSPLVVDVDDITFSEDVDVFSGELDFFADASNVREDASSFFNETSFIDEDIDESIDELFASEKVEEDSLEDEEEESSLQEIFYAECEEHIATINMSMLVIDQGGDNEGGIRKALAEMRRAFHTLKGAAGMTGFTDLSSFAHLSEDFLDALYESSATLNVDITTLLSEIVTVIEGLAYKPKTILQEHIDSIKTDIDDQLMLLKEFSEAHTVTSPDASDSLVSQDASALVAGDDEPGNLVSGPTDNVLVQLEKIDELQVLGGDIVTTRNAMVGFLDDLNQTLNELEIAKEKIRKISNELDEGFEIQALHGFGTGGIAQTNTTSAEENEFDVMELDRYSELSLIIRSLNETSVDLSSLHSELLHTSGNIRGQLSRQELTTRVSQNRLMRMRMTPLSSISRIFFQTVRSTAKELGKKVQLHIDGEDIYLDRFIWKKISDPIMHILRNSIDHGIETTKQRLKTGKPEHGNITITTIQRGNAVVLRIHDDGAGIDVQKLEDTLVKKNILARDHHLSDQQLLQYLFHAGITTKDHVSMVSGRGVGLDVVYKNIHELKGSVLIHTETQKGTTFEINVPISLSINKGIIISDNERLFAIPLQDIEEVIAYLPSDEDLGNKILWRGNSIEKMDLHDLVEKNKRLGRIPDKQLAVIFACGAQYKAVVIDSVKKQQEIVVKNLGTHLKKVLGISGVTDLGDGTLIPIINLLELSEKDTEPLLLVERETALISEKKSLEILVVDDSISVRQSVMRLLKNQGWLVTLAKDGVDALEKLQNITADLIISDIEMPRMNGYEFKEYLNNNECLRDIPVVMLTSRISPKHKQKAHDLGIQKFVTKPYKDDEFVALVRQLATQPREGR